MKISLLVPDLSCQNGNCMSRAYLFAKILQRRYEVEIVGFSMKGTIWEPVADDRSMTYKLVDLSGISKGDRWRFLFSKLGELLNAVTGDVLYASKPMLTTLGVGLRLKQIHRKPILVDLDDWQMGFRSENYKNLPIRKKFKYLTRDAENIYQTSSYWNNLFGEMLIRYADGVTVSNSFLQSKFNGNIVRHAVDTDVFDPQKFDIPAIRASLGISEQTKAIVFCGTPQVHKGIDDLVAAMELLAHRPDTLLVVVGNNDGTFSQQVVERATAKLGDRFVAFGLQPFAKIPEFLAIADAIVIPQRKNAATVGQVPIKVFEGMAMAKPVISTRVSDIPDILSGCGTAIDPEQPQQLADAIESTVSDRKAATELGFLARQKCVENYSWNAVEKVLGNLLDAYQ